MPKAEAKAQERVFQSAKRKCKRELLGTISTALAAAVLIMVFDDPAHAYVAVRGDRAAWSEVVAAYKALNLLSGYRAKMVWGSGSGTMVVEIVPLSGATRAIQPGAVPVETITVSGKTRTRIGDRWGRCADIAALDSPLPLDPLGMERDNRNITVTVTHGPDTVIDGASVRTYVYTHSFGPGGFLYKTTLYVGTQSGLPRRAVMVASHGGEQTIDYYDYGAKIEITLPPCE